MSLGTSKLKKIIKKSANVTYMYMYVWERLTLTLIKCINYWEIISNKNVLHQTKVHLTDLIDILYLNGDTGHKLLYVSTNISYWHFDTIYQFDTPHFCVCTSQELHFQCHMSCSPSMFNDLWWGATVHFLDIGGIVVLESIISNMNH
jgi:hypothetical protein